MFAADRPELASHEPPFPGLTQFEVPVPVLVVIHVDMVVRIQRLTANKPSPSWSDVKARLADFDRGEMIKLIQGLYTASRENKVFLHTRFGLGQAPLEQYKDLITR